jgi:hypothetical protein
MQRILPNDAGKEIEVAHENAFDDICFHGGRVVEDLSDWHESLQKGHNVEE